MTRRALSEQAILRLVYLALVLVCVLAALPGGVDGGDVIMAFCILVVAPVWVAVLCPWLERTF